METCFSPSTDRGMKVLGAKHISNQHFLGTILKKGSDIIQCVLLVYWRTG